MNDLEMNIAVARGEALAASLLASAALQAVFTFVPPQRREELLSTEADRPKVMRKTSPIHRWGRRPDFRPCSTWTQSHGTSKIHRCIVEYSGQARAKLNLRQANLETRPQAAQSPRPSNRPRSGANLRNTRFVNSAGCSVRSPSFNRVAA